MSRHYAGARIEREQLPDRAVSESGKNRGLLAPEQIDPRHTAGDEGAAREEEWLCRPHEVTHVLARMSRSGTDLDPRASEIDRVAVFDSAMRVREFGGLAGHDGRAMLHRKSARAREEIVVHVRLDRERNATADTTSGVKVLLDLALRIDDGRQAGFLLHEEVGPIAQRRVFERLDSESHTATNVEVIRELVNSSIEDLTIAPRAPL
jgi:hypothetical protein